MSQIFQNSSYLGKLKTSVIDNCTNNERMQKLAEKLGRITSNMENEK